MMTDHLPKQIVAAGDDQLPAAGKGKDMHKTDVERLFLMLLGERLLVENEKKNAMGFCNSYLAVPKDATSKRKLNSLGKQRLVMSMGRDLPKSKERAPKTKRPVNTAAKSNIIALQVNKPVRSGVQQFVNEDEEEEEEEEIETIGAGDDEDDDDGITIESTSTRSVDSSTGSRSKCKGSAGYGDETDGTYHESDEEADADSSDDEEGGEGEGSEMGEDEDAIEVIYGIKDESDAYDSDVELVPAQATAPQPKAKSKSKSVQAKGKGQGSEIDHIREHYTKHIFFALQEIAQEVS